MTARFTLGLFAALLIATQVRAQDGAVAPTDASAPEPAPPQHAPPQVHVVRPGDTLASIAERYYGDPLKEGVLVAENGLAEQGGSAIVVGMRLLVPVLYFHRVETGDTWASIARHYYGDHQRAWAIQDANRSQRGKQPDLGAELTIPYPLRHVAGQNETLRSVAKLYLGGAAEFKLLRRFNQLRTVRLHRGQIVLVPLPDLTLSEEGHKRVAEAGVPVCEDGSVQELQAKIDEELPKLGDLVAAGQYAEAAALGNRLLGAERLTGNQRVTIQRHLATVYVAFGRKGLAIEAFEAALQLQPDLQLDSQLTSPRILSALQAARKRLTKASAADKKAAPAAAL